MKNWFEGSKIEERHHDFGSSLVLGNQWGDEGKGKISDRLMQESDIVVRFNGGHNAGHTVKVGDKEFDLHILPSGMVTEGKINIITSGCVLGIHLNKIDISKIKVTEKGVYCDATLNELLKKQDGKIVEVGIIPELIKLQKGGIDISKSGLKISGETIVIGMHNVLLDAYDEQCREVSGLRKIGSTGSGISRAYASEIQRFHFSLNDLLYNQDLFYDSINALWEGYKHVFPNIGVDALINSAKKEREKICEYIQKGDIEIIGNESQYIKSLQRSGKKIVGEGAQSSMIGSGNSFFGTASDPSLQNFMNTTGLTTKKVGNIFLVHKIPASSVGERPGYLKHEESPELNDFREKYNEHGVSTGRDRDLYYPSLPETARGAWLNIRGIDTESKIVPVYNRVDGLQDSLKITNGILRVVTGFSYHTQKIIHGPNEIIQVGVGKEDILTPKNLLKNYPEKSAQARLFDLTEENLIFAEISGNITEKTQKLLAYYNAAIFRKNDQKEFLNGTGPSRDDLELRKGCPSRLIL